MGRVAFTNSSCGASKGSATSLEGGLSPGDQVQINGTVDLSSCIVGSQLARVYTINLDKQSGILYGYVITVVAEGPHGLGSGWLKLWFTDRTGDTYALAIWKSEKLQHTVAYNSDDPAIVKIEWGS